MRIPFHFILAVLFVAALVTPVAAGVVIEEKVVQSAFMGQPGKDSLHVLKWSGDRLRVEESGNSTVMIVRGDLEKLWLIEGTEKTWSEMTFQQVRSVALQSQQMLAAMGGAETPQVSVKETGKTKDVAGYPTRQFLLTTTGALPMEMDVWVSEKTGLDGTSFRRMTDALGSNTMLGSLSQEMQKLPGFPMEWNFRMTLMGQSLETHQTVIKIAPSEVPDALFDVPSGFRKVKSPLDEALEGTGSAPAGGPAPAGTP